MRLLDWEPSNGAAKPGKPNITWKDSIKRDLTEMKKQKQLQKTENNCY